ncbi:hypothetical protein [Pleionea sediminis]|uniref:hypothetical protein n=1 Tax=Pleionea sediminis TaxID=2569479 RepID=UPI00118597FF|nr:hypothetical protein [Pleionea sediminis]
MRSITTCILFILLNGCAAQTESVSLSGSKIASNLKSSDYKNQLTYPKATESLHFLDQQIFENPMWGTHLRYEYLYYPDDRFDVFVYPIAESDWSDSQRVAKEELTRALQEIRLAEKHGYINKMRDIQQDSVQLGDAKGAKATFEFTDRDGEVLISHAYVFTRKDKFVKFRFSFFKGDGSAELPDANEFAKDLLSELEVPAESPYMATMRKTMRQQRALLSSDSAGQSVSQKSSD